MKLDRLLGILTVLLQKDRVTAPELAEKFEVSRRTIGRDIDKIGSCGGHQARRRKHFIAPQINMI